jgi:hypothetical protein
VFGRHGPADVMDRPTLVAAFEKIKDRFGAVDALEYSPAPQMWGLKLGCGR